MKTILTKNKVNEVFEEIDKSDSICIIGHKSPDGDCIGSIMTLYSFIVSNYPHKEVVIGVEGKIPYNLVSLIDNVDIVDINEVCCYQNYNNYNFDLALIVDCGDLSRLGKYKIFYDNSKFSISIDHHKTNTEFANINIVDPDISSTGELLYQILKCNGKKIDVDMAKCMYIAIVTDTGKFSYSSTSKYTHLAVAELIEIGVDVSCINNLLYNSKPFNIVNAYMDCISNINFYHNKKLGVAKITKDIVDKNNIDLNDIEGVVEFIREIDEIEVSCVLKEIREKCIKVSLRSKNDIDVAEISKVFNGGGHRKAAGFTVNANICEAEKLIINEFTKYLGE